MSDFDCARCLHLAVTDSDVRPTATRVVDDRRGAGSSQASHEDEGKW